jgi:hypothetical protein
MSEYSARVARVHTTEARQARHEAAERYKPEPVDLLIVAEAPPGALDRYFYFEDVTQQDSLFRYVARGVLGAEPTRANKAELLAQLKERGVFLVDLKPEPVDGTPLADSVPGLIERCRALAPRAIVLVKATVYDAVYSPMKRAGLPVVDERIPFPGSGQQRRFQESLARALQTASR